MKYYKSKEINKDLTTYTIQADRILMYERKDGWVYSGVEGLEEVQYKDCEVTEISFEEIKPILENCRFRKDIELIKNNGCGEENYQNLLKEFGLIEV